MSYYLSFEGMAVLLCTVIALILLGFLGRSPSVMIFVDPRIGKRFCKVEMRDCMASTRGEEKWGTIVDVGETPYNKYVITDAEVKRVRNISHRNRTNSWLQVRYEDGTLQWEPYWWCHRVESELHVFSHWEYQI